MSNQTSNDSIAAMRDQDRHAGGDNTSHAQDSEPQLHGHEHTKAEGDLRNLVDKEETRKAVRGEHGRGN
jgi:hypothetical protein